MVNCCGSQKRFRLNPILARQVVPFPSSGRRMPALSFEKIKGYKSAHIVTNIHGSWPNHALAMGMAKDSGTRAQCFEFVKRYQQYPGKVERVRDAPWMENVIDKGVNLFDIMPPSSRTP